MTATDPRAASMRGRLAASVRWSREDPNDPAGPLPRARAAFMDRFAKQVRAEFPDLDDAEVARRAEHAKQAYFLRMALASAKARKAKAGKASGRRRSTADGAGS